MSNSFNSSSPSTMATPDLPAKGRRDTGEKRQTVPTPSVPFPIDLPPIVDQPGRTVRLILVIEGGYDVQFLRRIGRMLHADDPRLPDLWMLEQSGKIVFVPCGGSNFCHWTHRLSGLGIPEFHLYDREVPPLTTERRRAADLVNQRPGCHAVLTGKRAMENYLDPQSLREARGIDITFGDDDDVPQLVAQRMLEQSGGPAWSVLPSRGRRRLKDRTKKWLNVEAVERMTADRLAQRDPDRDGRRWLTTIAWMCGLHDGSARWI
jgi:hypothetical protein